MEENYMGIKFACYKCGTSTEHYIITKIYKEYCRGSTEECLCLPCWTEYQEKLKTSKKEDKDGRKTGSNTSK